MSNFGDFDQLLKGNRRGLTRAHRLDGQCQFPPVSLIFMGVQDARFVVTCQRDSTEIVQASYTSRTEHLEILLGHGSITIRQIKKICDRAILKQKRNSHVIATVASAIRQTKCRDGLDRARDDKARPIDEVAQLTD